MVDSQVIACEVFPPFGALLQSLEQTQARVTFDIANITIQGTLYVEKVPGYRMTVATIEGTGVVGALGATRVIQPGGQVTLWLGGDDGLRVVDFPAVLYPFDVNTIQRAPLGQLQRPVRLPPPIAPPANYTPLPTLTSTPTNTIPPSPTPLPPSGTAHTPDIPNTPTASATPAATEPAGCVIREDWIGLYTIQRGDTLSSIASRFNLNMVDIQEANCIVDPNRIRAGQILHLPAEVFLGTMTPTTTASVNFYAEQDALSPGQCTTMRWEVAGASAIYFEGELTSGDNARQVCPGTTTGYTLLVIYPDGQQTQHTLTIAVIPGTSVPSG